MKDDSKQRPDPDDQELTYSWVQTGGPTVILDDPHAASPGFTLPGDVAASCRYFEPDLIGQPIEVREDGTIEVPSGAGIGVDPVPARLTAATRQTERFTA